MPHSNKDNRHPVLHLSVEQTKFTSCYTNLTHNFLDQFSCSLNLTFVASNSYSSFLRCLPFRNVLQYHLEGRNGRSENSNKRSISSNQRILTSHDPFHASNSSYLNASARFCLKVLDVLTPFSYD